jgi:hydroxymethylbilane synthase
MNGRERRLFRIGTRGSKLALWQANHVADRLRCAYPAIDTEICIIHTTGDKILDTALSKIGDKGLFTKELERALVDEEVDCCVHSMKDMPTALPAGLVLAATLERADVRDALVASTGTTLETLPQGATVGTGSLRRRAQLRSVRSDLDYRELRGNLDTRIAKVESGELDAVVLAAAGIDRMGWTSKIVERISADTIIPAVGQGAIGIEIRDEDAFAHELCSAVCDDATFACVAAERHVMRVLEGGCQVPIGAWARFDDDGIVIDAMVAALDGSRKISAHAKGEDAAQRAVDDLLAQGAEEILAELRES